jgi:hypothetical protein
MVGSKRRNLSNCTKCPAEIDDASFEMRDKGNNGMNIGQYAFVWLRYNFLFRWGIEGELIFPGTF